MILLQVRGSKGSSPHWPEFFSLVVGHVSSLHPGAASLPLVASLTCRRSRWACLNNKQSLFQASTVRRRRSLALLRAASGLGPLTLPDRCRRPVPRSCAPQPYCQLTLQLVTVRAATVASLCGISGHDRPTV